MRNLDLFLEDTEVETGPLRRGRWSAELVNCVFPDGSLTSVITAVECSCLPRVTGSISPSVPVFDPYILAPQHQGIHNCCVCRQDPPC